MCSFKMKTMKDKKFIYACFYTLSFALIYSTSLFLLKIKAIEFAQSNSQMIKYLDSLQNCHLDLCGKKADQKELLMCLLAINLTISTAMNFKCIRCEALGLFDISLCISQLGPSPGCVCTQLQIVQTASGLISTRALFIPPSCRLLLNANIVTAGWQTDRPQRLSDKELQSDTRGHLEIVKQNFTNLLVDSVFNQPLFSMDSINGEVPFLDHES